MRRFNVRCDDVGSTPISLCMPFFSCSNESQFQVLHNREADKVPLVTNSCLLDKISTQSQVEGKGGGVVPNFCYMVVSANFTGTWKCVLSINFQIDMF